MHTALCAFKDRASANRALEQLVDAGIDRRDVHVEDRAPHTEHRSSLENFGRFVVSLLGQDDHPTRLKHTYGSHLERGGVVVVVVDGHDQEEADRALELLRELQARDTLVLHRPQQRPLRDIVRERHATGIEGTFGTARSEMPQATAGHLDSIDEDLAMAAARAGEKPEFVDGDKPGLKLKNMGVSDGL